MIYIIHGENKVKEVLDENLQTLPFETKLGLTDNLFLLAERFPEELIIWSHEACQDFINTQSIPKIFHHKRIMASFGVNETYYITDAIGYVDQSVYIKVNRSVTFPTWIMSSDIGGMHAKLLNTVFEGIKRYSDFDYFLNTIAKQAMPQGLFCYSVPSLLSSKPHKGIEVKKISSFKLFKFVRENYKLVWVFVLFFQRIMQEKQFPFLSLLRSLFYKRNISDFDFTEVLIVSSKELIQKKEIDVVIPTIGRKPYLHNVLKDLSKQTILPKNVIIVEQDPDKNSKSELDYLTNEDWPFHVKHKFIHQTGVCNARNLGMGLVESEWTFLGDDDNRFESDLIESVFHEIEKIGAKAISTVYIKPDETQSFFKTSQTSIFGGGNSFVKSEMLKHLKFDLAYEFNYGEDSDFGMQLRHLGEDVIFCPNIKITHLKAPVGGYRVKVIQPWSDEPILPKPSPAIMLFNLRYFSKAQLHTYKLLLFLKFYKHQNKKNPFGYWRLMKKSWKVSTVWAHKLMERANA
ncbi:glycosyltransferase family 2 protein [Hyunsoonleella rubra]|uniref:Glycosyltransferase family 2 protein n=1 Tax=Hyunsoonleella rubra TaxID=1737062 RepID=A0ABW5TE35_9FLAO